MGDAIERLKNSVTIYEDLKHESLIRLIDHFPVQSGYVLIFDWFDGECLHSHWRFHLLGNIKIQTLHFINLDIYLL